MSVVITKEDLIAYAEVDYIIHHMNEKYMEKIPTKIKEFFSNFKNPECEIYVNPYKPLQEQGLQQYTLEIIALLHLKYWCENEERKQELYDLMEKNQEKLDEQMREKYSVENLFNNDANKTSQEDFDFQNEDFSRPKIIQKYEVYKEINQDIQDYTDFQDVSSDSINRTEMISEDKNRNISIFRNIFKN